ncbi:proline-, glutamic acid- and leucine-rich protein 1-like [Asterias amurensis]|uniref:proline-, glutamic acid- and leucine-rich protein 1-like n=1 Tax=Asterias amurensis TaxID=7602 RepID=UPI003AB2C54B
MALPIVDNMCSTMLGLFKQESNKQHSHGTAINLLPSFTEDSTELQIFRFEKSGNLSSWVGHINSCLNSTKTRLEGVSLLRALVPQCPLEIFQQHCLSWVRLLVQSLQSYDSPPVISLVASTLEIILQDAAQVSELSREVSNSCISIIMLAALDMKQLDSAISLLSACIQNFPGPCGPFRTRAENFFLQVMYSEEILDISLSASRCLALLPRVGGGGQGGIKHIEAWSFFCHRVLTSMTIVLDDLYGETDSGSKVDSAYPPLGSLEAPSKEPSRTCTLIRHFKVLSACLQHMIRAEFPEIVKIPVNPVLSLCYRVLALNGKMLSKKVSLQWTLLAGSLSTIHTEAFSILSALISSCRGNLIVHGDMINKLFIQTLGWTMNGQSDDCKQRPYSCLRQAAYSTLETWLETVGACTGIESCADKLLEQILNDASPQIQTTKLKMTGDDKPAPSMTTIMLSGKAKQKGQVATVENASSLTGQQRIDRLANSEVCLASLKVLRCIIMNLGSRVKPDVHKDVHDFAIPLLVRIQQVSLTLSPAPYSSVDCRKALYHVLLSCVIAPHPRWPAPIQCATSLFSRGRQDTSITVTSFCTEASIICQSIIHPRVPSLQYPVNMAQLEPKRSTNTTYDLTARSDLGFMDTNDVGDDSALLTNVKDNTIAVSSFDGWRAPPSDQEGPLSGSQLSTATLDNLDQDKQGEESSDESEDEEDIKEEQQGSGDDKHLKDTTIQLQEVTKNSTEASASQESMSCSEAESQTAGDRTISIAEQGDVDPPAASLEDGRRYSTRRRSKRQLTKLQNQARNEDNDADGKDEDEKVTKKVKKGKSLEEDKINVGDAEDKVGSEEMTEETASMLASFVDSMPDED